jgi:methionine-rich copper-binding protein CopC
MRQQRGSVFLVLAALLIGAPSALAHALLRRASPAAGSTIRSAPAEIALRFTESIEPDVSTVQVTGPGGDRFDDGPSRVDGKEPTVLRIRLKKLPPGTYKVVWRVLSIDTHVTTGTFTFSVAP